MHNPTDVAASERQREEIERRLRRQLELEKACVKRVASGVLGRELLMRVIERAGIFQLSFNVNQSEATHLHAFTEGRRNEGLWLYNLVMTACPELWPTMVEEHNKRKEMEASA